MGKNNFIIWLAIFCLAIFGCNNANSNNNITDTTTSKKNTETKKPDTATVKQQPNKIQAVPIVYDSTKKYIYLTFDDGPHAGTKDCLELCKKLGVKATFFMVGRHGNAGDWEKNIVKDIRNSYPNILLANHSYTHANEHYKYFYQHPDMAEQDFYNAQQSLGVPFKIVRLPGNSAWVRKGENKSSKLVSAVCKRLDSAGYNVIGWDVEWRFTRGTSYPVQSPSALANEVNNAAQGYAHTKNHVMILTHDRMFRTPNYKDSLEKFINLLKQNPKYIFETVDHYPNLKL